MPLTGPHWHCSVVAVPSPSSPRPPPHCLHWGSGCHLGFDPSEHCSALYPRPSPPHLSLHDAHLGKEGPSVRGATKNSVTLDYRERKSRKASLFEPNRWKPCYAKNKTKPTTGPSAHTSTWNTLFTKREEEKKEKVWKGNCVIVRTSATF